MCWGLRAVQVSKGEAGAGSRAPGAGHHQPSWHMGSWWIGGREGSEKPKCQPPAASLAAGFVGKGCSAPLLEILNLWMR